MCSTAHTERTALYNLFCVTLLIFERNLLMEKFNAWKILALLTVVFFVGCEAKTPNNSAGTGTGNSDSSVSGTGDASSGAGTGTGGTETDNSGKGNATSGAGTGAGGTAK